MEEHSYTVKTGVFEGPLDILLELITERKLFVNDVSLAQVTDDFIKYLAEHEDYPLGESAEFIVVASTLMLIKSRSLLPTLKLTEEEEESIHDLEDRLALYARVKELSLGLKNIFGKKIIFEKTPSKHQFIFFSPDSKTDTANLLEALERVIESLPKKEVLSKVTVKKVISLEEMIERLSERITRNLSLSFKHFTKQGAMGEAREERLNIIVGFLAVLELVKRGILGVRQEQNFGDITMQTEQVRLPKY